ncbi:hypothetical protein FOA43_002570 [Brettanomyces nanus]|uniref:UDENN domain-containing protein n=1 Tax=Eeniella nana TaxID=13502 RepID=A0A875RPL8_EENNA|nr:uncharacterized protein FOA43_002570 [Brettanomyces nanus]QPG75220.1 hypothetical protein FOA43_002570 [Brettanomyces nanus]
MSVPSSGVPSVKPDLDTPTATDSSVTAPGSAISTSTIPDAVFDYIVCTDFDKTKGLNIAKQFPLNLPLISNQLDNLLGLVMPLNLHKFLNKEHYSLIPLYIDSTTGVLSYARDTPYFVPCYLYSLSYFQHDDSYRNGTAKAISIVSRLPIVHVFKPLMYYLLREQFSENADYSQIEAVWNNINKLCIPELVTYFENLSYDERFVLSRLEQGEPPLPAELKNAFPQVSGFDSGFLIKTAVNLGKGHIKFPIQIPISSMFCSKYAMFGSDLQKDSNLRSFLLELRSSSLVFVNQFSETAMTPYVGIKPLMVFLNAMLLHKKIVLYCYDSCYNRVMDFGSSLFCLFNDYATTSAYLFYPIMDLGTLDLIENSKCFLIGTSNPLFKDKVDWDIYYDMDSKKIFVKSTGSTTYGSEFFYEGPVLKEDKRKSVIGTGFRNLFKKYAPADMRDIWNDSNSAIASSNASSISSMSSSGSISASLVSIWNPNYFPRINHDKISKFLDSQENSDFQFGFKFQKIAYGKSIFAGKSVKPSVDVMLDTQVKKLLKEHHTDLTIYMVLTNYLRNLTSNVLPSFYHYLNHVRLSEYRSFVDSKLEGEAYVKSSRNSTSTFLELRNFIKNHKVVQPFPLNFRYSSEMTFLDDVRQSHHYAKIVSNNCQLLKLALAYNHLQFRRNSRTADQIPGFLFDWQGETIRYDPHYAISVLDKLIDGKTAQSWNLNGYFLLQFYKAINQILKSDKDNLSKLLADFFVVQGDFDDNKIDFTNDNRANENRNNVADDDDGNNRLDLMTRCYNVGMGRFNKFVLIAATYQIARENTDPTQKKDLLLTEFKKVLSSVLNNPFFKGHMVHHLDDFMKLNINDFIDYHM